MLEIPSSWYLCSSNALFSFPATAGPGASISSSEAGRADSYVIEIGKVATVFHPFALDDIVYLNAITLADPLHSRLILLLEDGARK